MVQGRIHRDLDRPKRRFPAIFYGIFARSAGFARAAILTKISWGFLRPVAPNPQLACGSSLGGDTIMGRRQSGTASMVDRCNAASGNSREPTICRKILPDGLIATESAFSAMSVARGVGYPRENPRFCRGAKALPFFDRRTRFAAGKTPTGKEFPRHGI
jgi:hypothetical protein